MSNALALMQQQIMALVADPAVYLVVGLVVSVVIAIAAGVFSPRSLRSPDRLAADQQPGNMVLIFLAGLAVWILTPAIYAGYRSAPAATRGEVHISPAEQVMLSAVAAVAALIVLVVGNLAYRRNGLTRLGFDGRRLLAAIPQGIVGIICILPLMAWISIGAVKIWELLHLAHPAKHELLEILDKTHDVQVARLLVFTAVLIAPVYEEMLFRGHLQSLLRHLLGRPWAAIVLTSAAFALVHPWWTQPPILFLSLCLGYAYERRGNLWLPVVIHSLFNGISILASHHMGR